MVEPFQSVISLSTVCWSCVEYDFSVHTSGLGIPIWWIGQIRDLAQIV